MLFSVELGVSNCSWKQKAPSCSNEIKTIDVTFPDFHQGILLQPTLHIWVQNTFLEARRVTPTLRLSQAHFFQHIYGFFFLIMKWPHVDAKYLLIFLHFLFFFFLKYIRCCSNCSLHAVHFDDQRPEAVSVWPEFLHWTCQQILGICICAKQSTWTRWVPCLPFSCYAYLEQNKESTLSKCHQVQCCSFSSASLAVCLKNSWAFVVVSKLLFLQLIWQSVKPWDWLLLSYRTVSCVYIHLRLSRWRFPKCAPFRHIFKAEITAQLSELSPSLCQHTYDDAGFR